MSKERLLKATPGVYSKSSAATGLDLPMLRLNLSKKKFAEGVLTFNLTKLILLKNPKDYINFLKCK